MYILLEVMVQNCEKMIVLKLMTVLLERITVVIVVLVKDKFVEY